MILYINEKNLSLEVRLAPSESYTPDDEIARISAKAKEIKEVLNEFVTSVYDPQVKELLDMIKAINQKNNPQIEKQ